MAHLLKSLMRFTGFLLKGLSLWLLCATISVADAQHDITVWTYYSDAPFITQEEHGLSYEFIDLLNHYSLTHEGLKDYHFKLELVPRKRLNRNLSDNVPGMVLFVNWSWMGDKNRTKYLWSDEIIYDRNEIVSRAQGKHPNRVNYLDESSLKGLVFGGVSGHFYKGLEDAFKSGDIIRLDVRNEEQSLDLLLRERIDITSVSSSVLNFMLRSKGIESEIYISPIPMISYTRHLLITQHYKNLESDINQFISSLKHSPEWHGIKQKYAVR